MNFLLLNRILTVWAFLFINLTLYAQETSFVLLEGKPVFTVRSDKKDHLYLHIIIKEGYHIQANQVNDENLVPTRLSFDSPDGIHFGNPIFPKTEDLLIEGLDNPWKVYSGKLVIKVPIQLEKRVVMGKGNLIIDGNLFYQACDDKKCFFPIDHQVSFGE